MESPRSRVLQALYMSGALRLAGFEGVALKDGVRAKGNSLIPGGFYAQNGQDLAEGVEHNVKGGDT